MSKLRELMDQSQEQWSHNDLSLLHAHEAMLEDEGDHEEEYGYDGTGDYVDDDSEEDDSELAW